MARNKFEDFPVLAKYMERMAKTSTKLNPTEWRKFCSELNRVCRLASEMQDLEDLERVVAEQIGPDGEIYGHRD